MEIPKDVQIAIITDATSDFGRECAFALVKKKVRVYLLSPQSESEEPSLAADLAKSCGRRNAAVYLPCDLKDLEQVCTAARSILRATPRVCRAQGGEA